MRTALALVAFTVFVQVAVAAGLIGACFMADGDGVDAHTVREYDRG